MKQWGPLMGSNPRPPHYESNVQPTALYDVCTRLRIMSRGQKHPCNAYSKRRAQTRAKKSMDLNYIDHLLDLLKSRVRAQPLQLNLRELTRVIHQMCVAIRQQYMHRHILSMRTRFLAVDATPGRCTKY